MLLATCQRVELYGLGKQPCPIRGMRLLTGDDAVRHLLRVAAGLESAVVGENEILGQVRRALQTANAACRRDPALTRLFEVAIGIGRRCRAGRGPTGSGLATLAARTLLDRTRQRPGPVLVIGAGYMGAAIANALVPRCPQLAIASRTVAKAAGLAGKLGVPFLTLAEASAAAPPARGLAVALAAPWNVDRRALPLPPTVDVSAPAAVPAEACIEYVGIDDLLARRDSPGDGYEERARSVVEGGVGVYLDTIHRRAFAV